MSLPVNEQSSVYSDSTMLSRPFYVERNASLQTVNRLDDMKLMDTLGTVSVDTNVDDRGMGMDMNNSMTESVPIPNGNENEKEKEINNTKESMAEFTAAPSKEQSSVYSDKFMDTPYDGADYGLLSNEDAQIMHV